MENTDFVIEHIDEEVQVIADQPSVVTNYPANTDFFIENIDSNVISIAHSLNIEASEVDFRPANTDFFIENIDKNVIAIAESMNLSPSEVDFRPANTDFFVENIDKNLIEIAESLSLTPYEVTIRPANTDMFIENIDKNVTLIKGSTNVVTVSGEYININLPDGGKVQTAQIDGNATQTTYSGKNLFDGDNPLVITGFQDIALGKTYEAGTYTFSCTNITTTGSQSYCLMGVVYGGSSSTIQGMTIAGKKLTITATEEFNKVRVYSSTNYQQSQGVTTTFTNFMLESGSTASDYEPYVGGIPAPNPSYPQPISVVTGENVVKIEGSDDTQEYPIDLGTTELAKIGTYQDRIYKNDGKWYIEKNVGKLNMADITGWADRSAGDLYSLKFSTAYNAVIAECISNIFTYNATTWAGAGKFGIAPSKTLWIMTGDTSVNATNISSWLANKNAVMYYALATPTTTEITNQTLIDQLEALVNVSIATGIHNIFTEIATGNAMPTLKLVIEKY